MHIILKFRQYHCAKSSSGSSLYISVYTSEIYSARSLSDALADFFIANKSHTIDYSHSRFHSDTFQAHATAPSYCNRCCCCQSHPDYCKENAGTLLVWRINRFPSVCRVCSLLCLLCRLCRLSAVARSFSASQSVGGPVSLLHVGVTQAHDTIPGRRAVFVRHIWLSGWTSSPRVVFIKCAVGGFHLIVLIENVREMSII